MSLPRARVLRTLSQSTSNPLFHEPSGLREQADCGALARARIVRREVAESVEESERIVGEAHAKAEAILDGAKAYCEQLQAQTRRETLERGAAELVVAWAALRARQASADEATLDRIIDIARLMAERLIRLELRASPDALVALAREAVAQFWQASQIAVSAHPEDAAVLESRLHELQVASAAVGVYADPTRSRGSLGLSTNIGTLDAEVGAQLDRLVETLRRSLAEMR